jgi:hypothetical protein
MNPVTTTAMLASMVRDASKKPGVALRSGVTEANRRAFEQSHEIRLPQAEVFRPVFDKLKAL